MKRLCLAAMLLILTISSALALTRLQTPAPATPRGSLEGTIVDSVTGQPIEGAQIAIIAGQPLTEESIQSALKEQKPTIQAPQITKAFPPFVLGGRTLMEERSAHLVVTDARGKFALTGIPAAAYSLAVRADGYNFQVHGEKPGTLTWLPLNINDSKADVGVIRMNPEPRISGRVVDLASQPVTSLAVYLMDARPMFNVDGERRFRVVSDTSTDSEGRYVLERVAAGKYYVVAGSSGRPELMRFSAGDRTGVRMPALSPHPYTYYPGVPDVLLAAQIDAPAGSRIALGDLVVPKTDLRSIRGRVVDATKGNFPASVRVTVNTWSPFVRAGSDSREILARVRYDPATGVFEATNLIPGRYRIDAVLPRTQTLSAQLGVATIGDVPPGSAFSIVELRHADVEDLTLTVPSNGRVTGKVVVSEGKPLPVAERNLSIPLQLMLRGLAPAQPAPTVTAVSVADGTFEVGSALEGKYRYSIVPLRDNYYVSEARLNGVRITSGVLDIAREATSELIFTLSPGGEIEGLFVDKENQPVKQAQGIVLPDPLPETIPFYQVVNADASGRFRATGIPPGNYKIFSLDGVEPSQFFDRALAMRFTGQTTIVRVEKGAHVTISVRVLAP